MRRTSELTMDPNEIKAFEAVCHDLYEGRDPVQRTKAQQILVDFERTPGAVQKCHAVIAASKSPYALVVSLHTVTNIVSKPANTLTLQERISLRT